MAKNRRSKSRFTHSLECRDTNGSTTRSGKTYAAPPSNVFPTAASCGAFGDLCVDEETTCSAGTTACVSRILGAVGPANYPAALGASSLPNLVGYQVRANLPSRNTVDAEIPVNVNLEKLLTEIDKRETGLPISGVSYPVHVCPCPVGTALKAIPAMPSPGPYTAAMYSIRTVDLFIRIGSSVCHIFESYSSFFNSKLLFKLKPEDYDFAAPGLDLM